MVLILTHVVATAAQRTRNQSSPISCQRPAAIPKETGPFSKPHFPPRPEGDPQGREALPPRPGATWAPVMAADPPHLHAAPPGPGAQEASCPGGAGPAPASKWGEVGAAGCRCMARPGPAQHRRKPSQLLVAASWAPDQREAERPPGCRGAGGPLHSR